MAITLDSVKMQAWLPEDKLIRTLLPHGLQKGPVFCMTSSPSSGLYSLLARLPGCPFMEQSPDVHLYTDATGSIGFGAFFDNQWFQSLWLPGHHLISITCQEVYPIYLACMLWGPMWANRRICFHCDNQAMVTILSTIMNLVRLITLQTHLFNFTFTSKHMPGVNNGIAGTYIAARSLFS